MPITLPLAPVVKAAGIDMTWVPILIAVTLQTSLLTPPLGVWLFYLKGVVTKGVTIGGIHIGILPFVQLQPLKAACLVFPRLLWWRPRQIDGGG